MIEYFFFNDTATTEIYTLSLHDALPILGKQIYSRDGRRPFRDSVPSSGPRGCCQSCGVSLRLPAENPSPRKSADRKSTRLNSSHANISYAVFCLKKTNQASSRTSSPSLT